MSKTTLNASAKIMHDQAVKMGIECERLADTPNMLIMKYNQLQWMTRGCRTSVQSSVGRTISNDKVLTKKVLQHYQLPTANSVTLQSDQDQSALTQIKYPAVFKPATGAHGRGVVTNIPNAEVAWSLFKSSQLKTAIVEEQLQGKEYRIICIDYKFVAAAYRKPAHVIGDGKHSVLELLQQKNAHPWRGNGHTNYLTTIEIDKDLLQCLNEQSVDLETKIAEGREIYLRKTANLSTGGEAWDVTDQVSPENAHLFEQIARATDLSIIGIDMMCSSLEQPITEQSQAGVIEVNGSPGLRMHHFPVKGQAHNLAEKILKMTITKLSAYERS